MNRLRSDEIETPGVCGEWSVSQTLWHISAWDELLIESLNDPMQEPSLDSTDRPKANNDAELTPGEDADSFNAEAIAQMGDTSPRQAIEKLEATHRLLRDALTNAPDGYFQTSHAMRRPIDEWSLFHYEEHTADIAAWADQRNPPPSA